MDLHILHSNDVHSELRQFAVLVSSLRGLRKELQKRGLRVLSFDIGDHIDMSYPFSTATNGIINADALRVSEYDGWVLGNNETVTVDPAFWNDIITRANTPLFCANLELPSAHPHLTKARLFTYPEVVVGVFGVTVQYPKLHEALGVAVREPVAVAWELAQQLRAQGADIVIMLSHLGLHIDQQLADEGLPVDVIVGSHTHHFLDGGQKRGNTWICQAGKRALAFGHTVLSIKDRQLQSVRADLVYTDLRDAADCTVLQSLQEHCHEAQDWLGEPVAELRQKLEHSLYRESQLVNLLCDQMREESHAEIAILHGGIVGASFREGIVRRQDLLFNCPSPMRSVTLRATGAVIAELLIRHLRMEQIMSQGYGYGFRGYFTGRLHVSGAEIRTRMDVKEDGSGQEQIVAIEIGNEPLQKDRLYSLATSEFVMLSPAFPELSGADFDYGAELLRDMLGHALPNADKVSRATIPRYRDIWQEGGKWDCHA